LGTSGNPCIPGLQSGEGSAQAGGVTPPSLEAYENERADFQRVLGAVQRIRSAPESELLSLDWLTGVIREGGLATIPDAAHYGDEEEWVNASQQGVVQRPVEFARFLQLFAEHRPATYLEVGCYNGATASLATAYLQRFNPALQATTIDLWPAFLFYAQIREILPLRYVVGKISYDLVDQPFDAVFIDADHSFEWAWADYQNVGRAARICAFHDVNHAPYRDLPTGGVPAVWDLIKRDEPGRYVEIFERPERQLMGIGVRIAPRPSTATS
jgi:SAM-dependent methyltransferase